MSAAPPSVVLVARRRASGGDSALVDVYQRYFVRMVALLRRRLPGSLRRRIDAADLAQSAWGSFLGGLQCGKLDLGGRETGLSAGEAEPLPEPSPAERLAVEETIQLLQQRLGNETQQEILRLRPDGQEGAAQGPRAGGGAVP